MVTLSIQLDDRLAEIVRQLAAAQERSESEVVSEALAIYAETKRPLPQGMGVYRSGQTDTSENARTILRNAVKDGQWP
jgi:predicted transcriptional regulator